jgi:hypothetical protein
LPAGPTKRKTGSRDEDDGRAWEGDQTFGEKIESISEGFWLLLTRKTQIDESLEGLSPSGEMPSYREVERVREMRKKKGQIPTMKSNPARIWAEEDLPTAFATRTSIIFALRQRPWETPAMIPATWVPWPWGSELKAGEDMASKPWETLPLKVLWLDWIPVSMTWISWWGLSSVARAEDLQWPEREVF